MSFGDLPIKGHDSSAGGCFAEYVKQLIDADGVTVNSQLCSKIMEEIIQKHTLPNFKATNYLLAHPDNEIRNLALALSTDKDTTISVNEESITNNLQSSAERLVADIEIAILDDKIEENNRQIHSDNLSDDEILQKLKDIQELKQAQVFLKKTI